MTPEAIEPVAAVKPGGGARPLHGGALEMADDLAGQFVKLEADVTAVPPAADGGLGRGSAVATPGSSR